MRRLKCVSYQEETGIHKNSARYFPNSFISSLEPKAHRSAYSIGKHPLSICRPSTFSNDISSEAMKPILSKFHI